MTTASINGVPIHYEDSGGEGPTILFSHGFLMDHTMFDAQVAALSDRYRCIRWDERGFGATPAPEPFTYWDSADDAVGVLDACGVERAVFVGMSQGGFLSLRAALAHPDRVAALVLIDSAADTDDDETIQGYRDMLGAFTGDDDAMFAGVCEIVAGLIIGEPELSAVWIGEWTARRGMPDIVHAADALLSRDDVEDRMSEITCPVLIIHGTADQAIAPERPQKVADAVVDCREVVHVDGAAHAPNMTHPDAVNAALERFLSSL